MIRTCLEQIFRAKYSKNTYWMEKEIWEVLTKNGLTKFSTYAPSVQSLLCARKKITTFPKMCINQSIKSYAWNLLQWRCALRRTRSSTFRWASSSTWSVEHGSTVSSTTPRTWLASCASRSCLEDRQQTASWPWTNQSCRGCDAERSWCSLYFTCECWPAVQICERLDGQGAA